MAAPRCVSVCMRATHPSSPYQAVGTDLCCCRLGWQLPAAAMRGLDNGTASCLIGYGSFPMTIRCPSDACFVLPLPCFHQTSYTAHKTSQSPRTTGRVGESWSSNRGWKGGSTGKARSSTAPRFPTRATVEPLGFSGQQFFSACLALAGARELRLVCRSLDSLARSHGRSMPCRLRIARGMAGRLNLETRALDRRAGISSCRWQCLCLRTTGRSSQTDGQSQPAPLLVPWLAVPNRALTEYRQLCSQSCWRTSSHTPSRQHRPTPGSRAISGPRGFHPLSAGPGMIPSPNKARHQRCG